MLSIENLKLKMKKMKIEDAFLTFIAASIVITLLTIILSFYPFFPGILILVNLLLCILIYLTKRIERRELENGKTKN